MVFCIARYVSSTNLLDSFAIVYLICSVFVFYLFVNLFTLYFCTLLCWIIINVYNCFLMKLCLKLLLKPCSIVVRYHTLANFYFLLLSFLS